MTESFEFRETEHFTAGALGNPGDRTFFLQAGESGKQVSVKIEKQQVAALAAFLKSVMDDLPSPTLEPSPVPLIEPALPEWVVGQIAVGVDEAESRVVLMVEEVSFVDEDTAEAAELLGIEPEVDTASLRVHLTVDQAASFIATSEALMSKSRPPCRLCGDAPDSPDHACPRLN